MATATNHALTYALALSLQVHLQDKLINNVPAAFSTMLAYTDKNSVARTFTASLIKIGRLQDDPTELSSSSEIPDIGCYIHYNDPSDEGDGWKDGITSPVESSMTNAAFNLNPTYEVGGGASWWRRFWLEWDAFYIDADFTQTNASRLSAALKHLLELYINSNTDVNPHGWQCTYEDPLGEISSRSQVVKSHCWEGGGPDDDYIWRGGVWFQVLTHRET